MEAKGLLPCLRQPISDNILSQLNQIHTLSYYVSDIKFNALITHPPSPLTFP
jgi:hypothetical protein